MEEFRNLLPPSLVEQEDVTHEEYITFVEGLTQLVDIPPKYIYNFERLSLFASVGKEIRAVILANGRIQEEHVREVNGARMRTRWTIEKPVEKHILRAHSDPESKRVVIHAFERTNKGNNSLFIVTAPFDRIKITDQPRINETTTRALRWEVNGELKSFYPTQYPDNPTMLQGYLKVLKQGVKELLSVVPPPVALTPLFHR